MRQRLASALCVATVLGGLALCAHVSLSLSEAPRLDVERAHHHHTIVRTSASSRTRVMPPLAPATLPPRIDLAADAAGVRLADYSEQLPRIASRPITFDARGPPLSA